MKTFFISKSNRVRSTPFTSRIEKQGVKSYTVYNHMLLPTSFSSPEEEYIHLKKDVQIWDVSVQREIEISGADSYNLVQLMTCRDLSKSKVGTCYYSPLVGIDGGVINDPLIYKLEKNKWRLCIADSDVILFAKGIAAGKKLNVNIFEAKVDTLAIQGPKSFDLMENIFGQKISELKFFKFDFYKYKNNNFLISRSGFSKQGGYEIHIDDTKAGLDLYDDFFEMGKKYNLKPGNPNHAERIEGGLLSYGNDIYIDDNPFECGFDNYVQLNGDVNYLGKNELIKIKKKGIQKKLMGVLIDIDQINLTKEIPIFINKNKIGTLRSAAYSPKFKKVVGIAMIKKEYWTENNKFKIQIDTEMYSGILRQLPIK